MAADLADALAYQLFDRLEPISAAAEVVAGYHSVAALEEAELSLLLDLVAARLPISRITCGWRSSEHPENRDYILGHDPYTGRTLETLIDVDHGSALTVFREACGLGPGRGGRSNAVGIRRRIYGSAVRASWHPVWGLFYDPPLHLVRGEGVWLYDAEGRAYLDAYNNVSHVGRDRFAGRC